VCASAVKFKLSKVPGSDDLLKGLHRLLFNRDGTVSIRRSLDLKDFDLSKALKL
jgi:hypothetical protein